MELTVNGKQQVVEKQPLTLVELLKINEVKQPDMVSIQLNGSFVARDEFDKTLLKHNDSIDFLYFMGGGQQ